MQYSGLPHERLGTSSHSNLQKPTKKRSGTVRSPSCPISGPHKRSQINAIMEHKEYHISTVSERRGQTHASLYIPNLKSWAFLDTGASISIIRQEMVKNFHPTTASLRDITGQYIPVKGIAEIMMSLPRGIRIWQTFLVADIPHSPIILGSDFMKSNQISLNFRTDTLHYHSTHLPILYIAPPYPKVAATQTDHPQPANPGPSDCMKNVGFFVVERNTSIPFLVDSGAMKSIIASSLLTPSIKHHQTLFSITNNSLGSTGTVTLEVDLGLGRAFSHSFVVVKHAAVMAVLGLDFLREFGLTVDCNNNRIIGPDTSAPMAYGCHPSPELAMIFKTWTGEISKAQAAASVKTWRACRQNRPQLTQSSDCVNIVYTSQQGGCPLPGKVFTSECEKLLDTVPQCLGTPKYFDRPKHDISLDIALKKPTPINHRPRPCPPTLRTFVRESLQDLMDRNVLQRTAPSHVSPITLVPKKDGKTRMCVDYTALNRASEDINYPLPRIQDLTSIISPQHKVFSVLDIREAYFSVPLTKRAQSFAGIITHEGAYKPLRCQFGLKNAPFKFCQLMDELLSGLKSFVFSYLDDIIIFSTSQEEHLNHLRLVLTRVEQFGLFLNREKCLLGRSSVPFLGRVVSQEGISVVKESTDMVAQQQPPSTLRGLRGFLGLINHYRPHIPKLAHIAAPLFQLLEGPSRPKRSPIKWDKNCERSFHSVITAVQQAATLSFDDPKAPIILSSDASQYHAGATLEQESIENNKPIRRPLAFFSKKLPQTTSIRSTFNRELCALRMAFQHFRNRIRGRKIIVYTDNISLANALANSSGTHAPVERSWIAEIKEYAPDVRHIPGTLNHVPDFLSRPDHKVNVINTSPYISGAPLSARLISQAQNEQHPEFETPQNHERLIKNFTDHNNNTYPVLGVKDSADVFRPYIPLRLRPLVFNALHDPSHLGSQKTYEAISCQFFWESLRKDIFHWAEHCPKCQQNKVTKHNRQRLHNFPHNKGRINTIHLDLVGPLPNSGNYPYIFTMRDRNTGFLITAPIRSKVSEGIIRTFEQRFLSVFGLPDTIITDQGTEFNSSIFQSFCANLGIIHKTTNPYHPQANGLVERIHRTLKTCIRSLNHPASWDKALPYITMAINNRVVDQNSFTPFQFTFGKPGRTPGMLISPEESPISDNDVRVFLDAMLFHESIQRPLPDNKPHIEKGLLSSKSVWVLDETRTPLAPIYKGPYEVLASNDKTFKLYINGRPKSISIDKVKAHKTCEDVACRQTRSVSYNPDLDENLGSNTLVEDLDRTLTETESEPTDPEHQLTRSGRSVRIPNRLNL